MKCPFLFIFIFQNIYMKKDEERKTDKIVPANKMSQPALSKRHVYSWDVLQHIPLFSRPYKAVNMETNNTATKEKLVAVFDLMKKLNSWNYFC